MPKTYSQLYERIISFENLYLAYCEARRGKKYRDDILQFHKNHEETLAELHEKLQEHTWRPDPYREFLSVTEVKRRVIHAPSFRDRVVHHALSNITRPLFEKKYIFDSYATIKGKGTNKAVSIVSRNSCDKLAQPGALCTSYSAISQSITLILTMMY